MSEGNPQDAPHEIPAFGAAAGHVIEGSGSAASSSEQTPLAPKGAAESPKDEEPALFQEVFGWKLLTMLFVTQHLMKGFSHHFIAQTSQFFYASYKVTAGQMQIFMGLSELPWAMKPMMGIISDNVPILGYHKAPYMFVSAIMGAYGLLTLGLREQEDLSLKHAVACFFLVSWEISLCDLFCEAKYSEKVRAHPRHGPSLLIFVIGGINIGIMIASIASGSALSSLGVKLPYLIALVPNTIIIFPLLLNFMEERRKTEAEQAVLVDRWSEQGEMWFLCILMLVGTMSLTCIGFWFNSPIANTAVSVCVALVLLVAFSILLRPDVAKVNCYFMLQSCLHMSIKGASFYFYIDDDTKFPNGPHFTMWFLTFVLGVTGAVFSLIGLYSYYVWAKDWTYRQLLLTGNLISCALGLLDVMLFTRFNLQLGIPDHVVVLGYSAFGHVIKQWLWVPSTLLISQLCPKDMEATMYAVLAGCANLGSTVAENTGSLLLTYLDVEPNGAGEEQAEFRNLWICSAISTLLPGLAILLIPVLIPNVAMTDKLDLGSEGIRLDVTSGSLWRKWTKTERAE